MIDRQDLIERAGELSLDPSVVEKDYALGWLLAGISQHSKLGPRWVFKGGTCLKKAKCDFKGIPIPTLAALELARDELAADWEHMLVHQLPSLPPFQSFWNELPGFFAWLGQRERPAVPAPYALAVGEQVVRPAVGALSVLGLQRTAPIERIRFAAANRLCVDLDYTTLDGRRSVRRIEPYSLRRTQDDNVILHAFHADTGGHRSYRVERIHGAAFTDQVFSPRYAVELIPGGRLGDPAKQQPGLSPATELRAPVRVRVPALRSNPSAAARESAAPSPPRPARLPMSGSHGLPGGPLNLPNLAIPDGLDHRADPYTAASWWGPRR